jgi:LacI family transcriptional regulator
MNQTTLSDIAAALNISPSTVSRALRNKPGVNPQLREKVFNMAQQLNYAFVPPKDRESKRIGVIVPDLSNPFFATVCYGVESVLRANGYLTYLANTDENGEIEENYVKAMLREGIDGLVAAPSASSEELYKECGARLPLVFFDRCFPSVHIQSVLIDNESVTFEVVRHLVSLGHTRICLVAGDRSIYTGRARTNGFLEALEILGLSPDHCPVVEGNFKEPEAYRATRDALRRHSVTAVVATSNKTSSGVLRALKDLGMSIPEDISVIGFDDQEWMTFFNPPITTIVQPAYTVGTLAASLLLQKIRGNSSTENVTLKASIVHRESVRPLKA